MSKIIKSCHLIYKRDFQEDASRQEDSNLTGEHMQLVYEEAKKMVEELLNNAKIKAQNIIQEAKKEAELILEKASIDAKKIREETFSKTYDEAYTKGKEEGLKEVEDLNDQANDIVKKAFQEKERILNNLEPEIINLSVSMAEKIIRRKLDLDPETVKFIAQNLLEMFQDAKQVLIKVNENDYSFLNDNIDGLKAIIPQGDLRIEIDNTLNNGDCIIISETGIVLSKIDSQLDKLRSALWEGKPND